MCLLLLFFDHVPVCFSVGATTEPGLSVVEGGGGEEEAENTVLYSVQCPFRPLHLNH
jgi:hypothetical protein